MKIKVYGVNVWASIENKALTKCTFLSKKLEEHKRPTPFMSRDKDGNELQSKMKGNIFQENRIKDGEVELAKGDYIMLLPMKDIVAYGEQACGHMHYYDGEKLISVYTKEEYIEMETKHE